MLLAVLLFSLDIAPLLNRTAVAGERICDASGLRTFYARRDMRPGWHAPAIASLLTAIGRLGDEGLEPARYHFDLAQALDVVRV